MGVTTSLLITYKYIILFPLAFIEGHMVTVLCGFLWKLGYINGYIAVFIIIAANLVGDIMWYYIGKYKGEKFVIKYGKYFNLDDKKIEKGKILFEKNGPKILLIAKLTNGFGMIIAILFASGMYKMDFKKYILMNLIGETVWSASLLAIGYFFGQFYTQIESTFSKIGLLLIGILLIVLFINLKNNLFKKIYV